MWKVKSLIPLISITLVNKDEEELILSSKHSESVFADFVDDRGRMTVKVGDEITEDAIPATKSNDGRWYCTIRGKVQEASERLLDAKARKAARNVKFDRAAREAKMLAMMDSED